MDDDGQTTIDDVLKPTIGKTHRRARDTERTAALLVAPRTGTMRAQILERLRWAGQTHEELAVSMNRRPNSVSPRITELTDGGWIEDSKVRRPTAYSGSPAIVWILTEKGRALLDGAQRTE